MRPLSPVKASRIQMVLDAVKWGKAVPVQDVVDAEQELEAMKRNMQRMKERNELLYEKLDRARGSLRLYGKY
jgi:hypothetical protein